MIAGFPFIKGQVLLPLYFYEAVCIKLCNWLWKLRGKSGLQYGSVKGESLSTLYKGEDQWNRKYVQSFFKLAGVKSAKLCAEQDQIRRRLSQAMASFRVDRKDKCSPSSVLTG